MEFLIWGAAAGISGLILGVLGYYHSKLAYTAFLASLSGIGFMANMFLSSAGASTQMGGGLGGQVVGGLLSKLMRPIEAMGYLPMHMQVAIIIFIVAFFVARIGVWSRQKFKKDGPEESLEARRKRVLASYGMKSMDDVRNLR